VPNVTEWRRKTFGDLTSAFRFDGAAAQPASLPDTAGPLTQARYEAASLPLPTLPGGHGQEPPAQEPGTRKRVPRG
jgi:phospholipase C